MENSEHDESKKGVPGSDSTADQSRKESDMVCKWIQSIDLSIWLKIK